MVGHAHRLTLTSTSFNSALMPKRTSSIVDGRPHAGAFEHDARNIEAAVISDE
jgi:hypothetical protein